MMDVRQLGCNRFHHDFFRTSGYDRGVRASTRCGDEIDGG